MTPIDFSHIPVADNHCHGIYRTQEPEDVLAWRRLFTESSDPGMRGEHVAATLFYRRLIREMAAYFGCNPTEEAVLAARRQFDERSLVARLLQAAHIEVLFLDKGYPLQELVLSDAELSSAAGCRIAPMLRVELVMQRLVAGHKKLSAVVDALRSELQDVRGHGYVALKSIIAYRGGLNIRRWNNADVEAAFIEARRESEEKGTVQLRLTHKPLLDTLLHVTFEEAARQELPVQFHVGYGDTDADMLLANPLHLRAVLEERKYRAMP
ncbi:MAG TPA: hypothetical protein VKR83_02630, partial [Ktedonobacteraceae bacterium]|nr:hypothetical protein [Ktedonobacteraceae bacterium]